MTRHLSKANENVNDPSHGRPDSASSRQEHAKFGNGGVRSSRSA